MLSAHGHFILKPFFNNKLNICVGECLYFDLFIDHSVSTGSSNVLNLNAHKYGLYVLYSV